MIRSFSRALPRRALKPLAATAAATLVACQGDMVAPGGVLPTDDTRGTPSSSASVNPLASFTFYIDQASNARRTADAWRATRPADAEQMEKIAAQPVARWIGNWNVNVRNDVANAVATITGAGRVPVFVAYNIPQRDCGGLSGGNSITPEAYRSWIGEFAAGLRGTKSVVILEPDALAAMGCLSATDQQVRVDLLRHAVTALTAAGDTKVYLDAGHGRWQPAPVMASRLIAAGIEQAAGFSLNISNFIRDDDNTRFGEALSSLVGGKHFIMDTGRNGLGPTADYQWCNPEGRAIGRRPTTDTGHPLIDAYLWIKTPGESDGACNGAPKSGVWMPEYALGLAVRG